MESETVEQNLDTQGHQMMAVYESEAPNEVDVEGNKEKREAVGRMSRRKSEK